mmetsp:Transcript_42143/g.78357  ORF Transcript_42143/g.78357 Transcript_42143/m.78357 type:complete len:516 (+) Transcript_42143:47-1594(+)
MAVADMWYDDLVAGERSESHQTWRRRCRRRRDTKASAFRPTCVLPSKSDLEQDEMLSDCSEGHVDVDAEDLCCYISLALASEEDTILGLGLFAQKRTRRQIRMNLPPDLLFSLDYLDVNAFNTGLDAVQARGGAPALVTSSRTQLNAWLPLYVNAKHWARAKPYLKSAVMALSGQGHEDFAESALTVCCSLLTQAAASLSLGGFTERGVQMYADSHRLLLQLGHEVPDLYQAASRRIRSFLFDPASRLRHHTHSLGDLMHCLLLVDDLDWMDLLRLVVPEALRRHVRRQQCKGFRFDVRGRDGTAADVLAHWEGFAPDSCKVLCFIVVYMRTVGRPEGCSLEHVMARFDRNGGRLLPDTHSEMRGLCSALQGASLPVILERMGVSHSEDHLAETLLWAVRYGSARGRKAAPREVMCEEGLYGPSQECHLLHRLREGKLLARCRNLASTRQWRPKQDVVPAFQTLTHSLPGSADIYWECDNAAVWWGWCMFYSYNFNTFYERLAEDAWTGWWHYVW